MQANVMQTFVALMSAYVPQQGNVPQQGSEPKFKHHFIYNGQEQRYYGSTTSLGVRLLRQNNLIRCGEDEEGREYVELLDRDQFLNSWFDGVKEARAGSDLHYADYSPCPFAFSAGHAYVKALNKSGHKAKPFNYAEERYCHGFPCIGLQGVFLQGQQYE